VSQRRYRRDGDQLPLFAEDRWTGWQVSIIPATIGVALLF
jgi:hypothetical protein